jgi:hypothetical protein
MATEFEEAIDMACTDLASEKFRSIRAAAAAYGLDHSTLAKRLKNGQTRRVAHSDQQLLSPEQEERVVQWILELET